MSYVNIPPAFYASLQPNTPFHAGSRGWFNANVPGWGMNPNNAWSARQGVRGLGAEQPAASPSPASPAPPAPFTWVGKVPFNWYIQQGISPWGRFPQGPAYASPRPSRCPGCVGTPIAPGVGSVVDASRAINAGDLPAAVALLKRPGTAGLGASCGPCEVSAGDRCLPCPNGSDLPECDGCVDGMAKAAWYEHPLAGPVAVGVATAVATGIAMAFLKKRRVPVE